MIQIHKQRTIMAIVIESKQGKTNHTRWYDKLNNSNPLFVNNNPSCSVFFSYVAIIGHCVFTSVHWFLVSFFSICVAIASIIIIVVHCIGPFIFSRLLVISSFVFLNMAQIFFSKKLFPHIYRPSLDGRRIKKSNSRKGKRFHFWQSEVGGSSAYQEKKMYEERGKEEGNKERTLDDFIHLHVNRTFS